MRKIAQQIKWLNGFTGTAALFKLDPPMMDDGDEHKYVVVSATDSMVGPETYIFPADENGNVIDWIELSGSFKGSLDIWKALRNAGYEPKGLSVGV